MSRGILFHSEMQALITGQQMDIVYPNDSVKAAILGVVDAVMQRTDIMQLRGCFSEIEASRELNGITIAGKIDMFDGVKTITDFKLTSRIDVGRFLRSIQIPLYAWLLNLDYATTRYIVAPQPLLKQKNSETLEQYRARVCQWAAPKVRMETTHVTKVRLDAVEEYLRDSIGLLAHYIKSGSFPCNFNFCENVWGVCPYVRVCQDKNFDAVGSEDFIIDKPNPELAMECNIPKYINVSNRAYGLLRSGALKSARRQMKTLLLLKAVIEDAEGRALTTDDLRAAGIVMNKTTLSMFDALPQIDLKSLIESGSSTTKNKKANNKIEEAREIVKSYNALANDLGLRRHNESTSSAKAVMRSGMSLNDWGRVAQHIRNSMFLRGQVSEFVVDLYWLIRNYNWKKVLDGRYSDDRESR